MERELLWFIRRGERLAAIRHLREDGFSYRAARAAFNTAATKAGRLDLVW